MNRLKKVSFVWGILPILLITMLLRTGVAEATGAWKLISGANPSVTYNGLRGVAAATTNDVWAVGAYSKTQNTHQPLIEHWNGIKWGVVSSPNEGSGDNELFAVAKVPSTQKAWAVGQYSSNNSQTIFEYYQ